MKTIQPDDLRTTLRPRDPNAHKNDFGHLLLVAGSRGMGGQRRRERDNGVRHGACISVFNCFQYAD